MINLYRGDKKGNHTEPELYYYDGLRSRAFGQGNPSYIKKEGLLKAVRQHIRKFNDKDRKYGACSDFLSFSQSRDIALFWMKERDSISVVPAHSDYHETHYLFTFNLDDQRILPVEKCPGLYCYWYSCNPALKESNTDSLVFRIARPVMYGSQGCEICQMVPDKHLFYLIDGETYLKHFPKEARVSGALEYTARAKEWLILPADPIVSPSNLPGHLPEASLPRNIENLSARIHRADFWTVEHFIRTDP